jgi:Ala-tRNA(Pro) deacylase
MAIALTLKQYLDGHHASYDVVLHGRTATARQTARECEVPNACLAKGVLLRDGRSYLLAVLPASRQLDAAKLGHLVDRPVELATENEAATVFRDCAPGAVPPIGPAYGLETVIDDRIMAEPEIYFEGGDHESLVHMRGEAFQELVRGARRGSFVHT